MSNSNTVIRSYQYKLYPRKAQKVVLDQVLRAGRFLYNHALAYKIKRYRESRKSVSFNETCTLWKDWRNEDPENNELRLLGANPGQQVLRRLDKTYAAFFRRVQSGKGGGFPRFKGRNHFSSLDFVYGLSAHLVVEERRTLISIQNIGNLKIKLHRPLPEDGTIKMVNIKKKASGWYVSFAVELPATKFKPNGQPLVGIDMGISRLLTLSNGDVLDNPRWLKGNLDRLRVAQRKLARRVKGSHCRRKARHQVALLHEHVANTRRDFWHKATFELVNHYGGIAIEKLDLRFMMRGNLSAAAHDAGLGMFTELLHSKAESAGCVVVEVNPRNTSQACSGCGCIVKKDLSVRWHSCPHCGLELDRDENAARNIYHLAFKSAGIPPSGVNVERS